MPSPFPGMDPFLDDQVWPDFHIEFISGLRAALAPALDSRYSALIGERIYLQYDSDERPRISIPDVTELRTLDRPEGFSPVGTLVVTEPLLLPLPLPEEAKEVFLEVRLRETHEVVTVIEILSPANKRAGGDGRDEYLTKRNAVLLSRTHLVELDLLRGGMRMPIAQPLPPRDYLALVSRTRRRPTAEVWPFTIRQRLPVVPIPLTGGDPDVLLDLQDVFRQVYDRARYHALVDYRAPLETPLPVGDQEWLGEILRKPEAQPDE